ncbi:MULTISPECIES: hypothetical protein [unclassified Diaminobutyricimonas]|uniref:hypothetical protein n=1 Tax=unclassified Diaminobutyricimonas TaxID=2643261 RepID=UPI0012F49F53|nr:MULTISPECIES: hypothetical protein [unclassified Diaminobutyricimonas]
MPALRWLAKIARIAITLEIGVWRSLWRLISRRPNIPTGAQPFGYTKPILSIMIIFIVLSAIEIPIVDLIVHQWPTVRIIALILGIWGVTFMIGFLAAMLTNPHAVSEQALHIRHGAGLDIRIDWDDIESIHSVRSGLAESKTVQLTDTASGTALHVAIQSETNVDVRLRHPVTVTLPKGEATITEAHFRADDPDTLVSSARARLSSNV